MIWILVLLVLALILVAVAFVYYAGLPDSRTAPGKRIRLMFLGIGVCLVLSIGLGAAILVQEETGVVTGLSGGVESDARQWISRYAKEPPRADQPGDNIQILREGLSFLNTHPSIGETAEAQAVMQRYSTLPARPTRLLTRQEEGEYYEGARAMYQLINGVAGQAQETDSK